MNSLTRRELAVLSLAGFFTSCATLAPKSDQEQDDLSKLPITHPDRQQEFNNIWRAISRATKAVPISDNRVRISSKGTLATKDDKSQQNFLIRAAAETLRAKKDGFAILHLDYFTQGPSLQSLTPEINLSGRRWIGNYEELLDNRNDQTLFARRRTIKNKAMDGVILMLNEDEFRNRDRFSADEVYLNLLNYKAQ